jgi:hypothetical protein
MASWACSNCWMELLMGEPSAFSLPFHPPLPLLVVPTGPDQLVSVIDPSAMGCTLSSAGGRSSSLFPISFLGLPLLHGVRSCGGAAPSIPPSGVLLSTPTSTRGTDTLSEQNPVPPVEASRTLEANKKESQARWGSDLALRLPRKPHPLFEGDPIVQQRSGLGVYR